MFPLGLWSKQLLECFICRKHLEYLERMRQEFLLRYSEFLKNNTIYIYIYIPFLINFILSPVQHGIFPLQYIIPQTLGKNFALSREI